MDPRPPEQDLAALQRRQHGAFARWQARDFGVPLSTVDGRVRIGRYRLLLPGVMAEAATPDSWQLRAMAALLWAGGDAVLARGSAARALDLPVPVAAVRRMHLLVRQRCFATPAGLVVHRTRRLAERHTGVVGPLGVTLPTRTICDLSAELGFTSLRRLVAAAARDDRTDATRLRAAMHELGRFRGKVNLRTIVDELSPLDRQCNTPLETDYLRVARAGGIEPTAMNHPVRDARGRRRYLDAVHLPEYVWIELDGRGTHSITLDRNDDDDRTEQVELAGRWRHPLRFTTKDVRERPGYVVHTVRSALDDARAGQPTTVE